MNADRGPQLPRQALKGAGQEGEAEGLEQVDEALGEILLATGRHDVHGAEQRRGVQGHGPRPPGARQCLGQVAAVDQLLREALHEDPWNHGGQHCQHHREVPLLTAAQQAGTLEHQTDGQHHQSRGDHAQGEGRQGALVDGQPCLTHRPAVDVAHEQPHDHDREDRHGHLSGHRQDPGRRDVGGLFHTPCQHDQGKGGQVVAEHEDCRDEPAAHPCGPASRCVEQASGSISHGRLRSVRESHGTGVPRITLAIEQARGH